MANETAFLGHTSLKRQNQCVQLPWALAWSSVRPTQAASGSVYDTQGSWWALKAAVCHGNTGFVGSDLLGSGLGPASHSPNQG